MAMGIVSDKDFESEVTPQSKSNTVTPPKPNDFTESNTEQIGVIKDVTRGRGAGNIEVPNGLRKIIGDESTTNGRQSAVELAENFGISPSSVSAYAQGANSTASYDVRPNASTVVNARDRVIKKARGKLMAALHNITGDKLEGAKPRDLAGIAKDMSAIIKNMEPDLPKAPGESSGPTFIFYSPQPRREESFDVITVKE